MVNKILFVFVGLMIVIPMTAYCATRTVNCPQITAIEIKNTTSSDGITVWFRSPRPSGQNENYLMMTFPGADLERAATMANLLKTCVSATFTWTPTGSSDIPALSTYRIKVKE